MKLSVIIPIYNVEKYLPRCLDSMLRQGLEPGEWEVICVNDGSPDRSAKILLEYVERYPDIFKIISQDNKGQGEARNSGMKIAQGDWITFLDSDDYVIDGAYKYILEQFCEEWVDVIHFDYRQVYTDGKSLQDPNAQPDGEIVFDGDVTTRYNSQKLPYVWTNFYYRPLLKAHRIRFRTSFMEDELFNFDVFLWHPRVRIVTSNVYRYEQGNANSLLTTVDKEKIKNSLKWLLYMIEMMNNYLKEGDGELEPAAVRNINMFSVHYFNKMLKAQFTWNEWRQYSRPIKLKRVRKLDVSRELSFWGKMVALLKNGSGTFYVFYLLTAFFLNTVFTRWIRPRIINSFS